MPYSYSDVQSQARTAGLWLRLKSGDEIPVVFMLDEADPDLGAVFYRRHAWNGTTYPVCTRFDKSDPPEICPLCKAGKPIQWRMRITVFNAALKKRQRLDGVPAMFFEDMKTAFKYVDPAKTVFVLTRQGDKAATRYPIHSAGPIPKDVADAMAGQRHFTRDELLPEAHVAEAETSTDDAPPPDDEDAPE